jgi:hypothetical protein
MIGKVSDRIMAFNVNHLLVTPLPPPPTSIIQLSFDPHTHIRVYIGTINVTYLTAEVGQSQVSSVKWFDGTFAFVSNLRFTQICAYVAQCCTK